MGEDSPKGSQQAVAGHAPYWPKFDLNHRAMLVHCALCLLDGSSRDGSTSSYGEPVVLTPIDTLALFTKELFFLSYDPPPNSLTR